MEEITKQDIKNITDTKELKGLGFWKEAYKRLQSETPIFWKKIRTIAIRLGISAVSVVGVDKLFDLQTYGVPQLVFTIAGYIIVVCATLGLAASITKP